MSTRRNDQAKVCFTIDHIPSEFRERPQWVGWCWNGTQNESAKIPKQPQDPQCDANVHDPTTWGTFDDASLAFKNGRVDGIGFVCTANDDFLGIELEDGIDSTPRRVDEQELGVIADTCGHSPDCSDGIPKITDASPHGFSPIPADQMVKANRSDPANEYVVKDLLPTGSLVMIAGSPKGGKTTFAYHLAGAVSAGTAFLGRETQSRRVLILATEESLSLVETRLKGMDCNLSNIFIHSGFLNVGPEFYQAVKAYIESNQVGLLVIDGLPTFWKVSDEKDATTVTTAIKPLLQLARETKCCVLLLHYTPKTYGKGCASIRGSNALEGLMDTVLIMEDGAGNTQRKLMVGSRYPNMPSNLVVELREGTYVDLEDWNREKVWDALTRQPETIKTIQKLVGMDLSILTSTLEQMADEGRIRRTPGTGRSKAILYSKKTPRGVLEAVV